MMKHCAKCKEWLDESLFRTRKEAADGLHYWCRPCENAAQVDQRFKKWGKTRTDFLKALEVQQYQCAICEWELKEQGYFSDWDHCHITGKLRGILCRSCNVLLSRLEARFDSEWLEKAERYLGKYTV